MEMAHLVVALMVAMALVLVELMVLMVPVVMINGPWP
jgi:hypothetical protein